MTASPPADSPGPPAGAVDPHESKALSDVMGRFHILNDLSITLGSTQNLAQKLQRVSHKSRELLGTDVCLIALKSPTGGGYHIHAASGNGAEALEGSALPEKACPLREADRPGAVWEIPAGKSALSDPDCGRHWQWLQAEPLSLSSGIGVCLEVGSVRHGFIFAGNRASGDFPQTDRCVLSLIGNLIAAEIHRWRWEESQLWLETVLEQAVESIMITDTHGSIQYVNPAFENITGYSREEALGRTPRFLKSGRQPARFYKGLWNTLTQGNVWRGHFTNRKKSGELYELEASISPVRNAAGAITHYVSVRNDVTQTLHLERQLRHAQKMEAIGTLAGGIAHDFNNLLMGIQGNVSLLLLGMAPGSQGYQQCKAVEDAVNKGADLTQQLLGFARGGQYQMEPMDLNPFIQDNLRVFGRTLKEIQIHTDFMDAPCVANIDPNQMSQVLLNLLVNAWQAMPSGGDLFVSTKRVRLNEQASLPLGLPSGDHAIITVRDTGEGIEEAILGRIFDPFFTTKKKLRGTGLGLASSYGIIKNHGGMITVTSRKHQGSTFRIYLPLSFQTPAVSVAASCTTTTLAGSETVLLVDDEAPVLDITRQMLEHMGYRVVAASSGRMAIEAFEKNCVDIVILDMIMPEMGGAKTFEQLVKRDPKVKILLSSGYTADCTAASSLGKGCVGFIQKPYSMEQISRKLREVLGRRQP